MEAERPFLPRRCAGLRANNTIGALIVVAESHEIVEENRKVKSGLSLRAVTLPLMTAKG